MELYYRVKLPANTGQRVNKMLDTYKLGVKISPVYTINTKLELVECDGVIKNNGSWDRHNNYDDSENEMQCIIDNKNVAQWFTTSKRKAERLQYKMIIEWAKVLCKEFGRLDDLRNKYVL